MPGLNVVVVARSELFHCGIAVALAGPETSLRHIGDDALDLGEDTAAPDVVLLEWNVADREAWERLRSLRSTYSTAALLVSSLDVDGDSVDRLLARGAAGVVHRSARAEELRAALADVHAGRVVQPAHPGPPKVHDVPWQRGRGRTRLDGLTERQTQIIDLVCAGLPNTQIAEQLHLSVNSVKSHIRGAYRTMDVQTRSQAILWGLARGYGGRPTAGSTPPARATPSTGSGQPGRQARKRGCAAVKNEEAPAEASDVPDLAEWLAEQSRANLAEADAATIRDVIVAMIEHPQFPCLGARSAVKRDGATVQVLDDMTDDASLATLADRLATFAAIERGPREFGSFIAVFRRPRPRDEKQFETLLWSMLQRLHDADDTPWAERVSPDPDSPHFSFSLGGVPFFLVGLHPQASRIARRAPLATVVFNLHDQFEQLRTDGGFDRMRDAIRRRDAALQGSINPVVTDHGLSSEARQYSGRHVEDDWRAPFTAHPSKENHDD